MIARILNFKSAVKDEDLVSAFESRSSRYREVEGLVQKHNLGFPQTGECRAVYVWDSHDTLDRFNASELAQSIPDVYRVEGPPGSLPAWNGTCIGQHPGNRAVGGAECRYDRAFRVLLTATRRGRRRRGMKVLLAPANERERLVRHAA